MADSRVAQHGQHAEVEDRSWIDRELDKSAFEDARLGQRLRMLLGQFAQALGQSIALVCQNWANTRAAYRFLSNGRVSEVEILAGHFGATRERIAAIGDGPVLMLHDTTEFSWPRDSAQVLGVLGKTPTRDAEGRVRHHTIRGILMHSSLAVTAEGLPLGPAAIKFWTRSKFKGTNALKRSINPTRVPIEAKESICWLDNVRQASALFEQPERCVHIGDRGSDIYEAPSPPATTRRHATSSAPPTSPRPPSGSIDHRPWLSVVASVRLCRPATSQRTPLMRQADALTLYQTTSPSLTSIGWLDGR